MTEHYLQFGQPRTAMFAVFEILLSPTCHGVARQEFLWIASRVAQRLQQAYTTQRDHLRPGFIGLEGQKSMKGGRSLTMGPRLRFRRKKE